jgi:hypothetical protein
VPVTKSFSRERSNVMLDLFYVAIGCITLFLFWVFTKACDKL